MAKTATDVPVTPGAGVNLSNFALASGRRRQTVIIGDADDAGEAALVELPAHDAPDRGSALKIGGRASAAPFADVAAADRTDAWLSLGGQVGTIATIEPATVYDGGRRAMQQNSVAGLALNNSGAPIVAGAAGLRTKVIAMNIQCVAFTTAGSLSLVGGGGSFWVAQITTVGQNIFISANALVQYTTNVNTALQISFTGNATFNASVSYYQAP